MKDFYLVNYSVKGIKSLDQLISLSFYKKTITRNIDTKGYNVKGIYGMNGAGKSAIITSMDILRNLLNNTGYLNNPMVQQNLDAIINKMLRQLYIKVDFIVKINNRMVLLNYEIQLEKNNADRYEIAFERLNAKKATSRSQMENTVFEVINGTVSRYIEEEEHHEYTEKTINRMTNLLSMSTMSALLIERIIKDLKAKDVDEFFSGVMMLALFGKMIHVFFDDSDDHRDYFIKNTLVGYSDMESMSSDIGNIMRQFVGMEGEHLNTISIYQNIISKGSYHNFEKTIKNLYEFLSIFKTDLLDIEIDRKEDEDSYICNLLMIYDSYKIDAEFESTGIKKLIRLFTYLREMVNGGIVFIDEFDSNVHDVYLCALLEYLMEYGEGQLCFTTHNVGPMDILKKNKNSIDFLTADKKIYSWKTNGNYSPSKLYRNGMIEGSPFNVDSIDFISAFSSEAEVD